MREELKEMKNAKMVEVRKQRSLNWYKNVFYNITRFEFQPIQYV